MSCPNCEMINHADASFCQRCGVQLAGNGTRSAGAATPRASNRDMAASNFTPMLNGGARIPAYDRKVLLISSAVLAWYVLIVSAVTVLAL